MVSQPKKPRTTSAQDNDFPPELRKWNWGAFLLSWIWGLGNRTYIALLALLPFANIVMPFVLGAKGNEWAWRNKHWDSIEHFKRVQRLWTIWGVSLLGVIILLIGIGVFAVMSEISDSAVVNTSVNYAAQNPTVREKLGSPIEKKGWATGDVHVSGISGYANGSIDIKGPQDTGTVYFKAYKEPGVWRLVQVVVEIHKSKELIEIVNYPPDSPEMQKYENERRALSNND
jgi:hypothetical protein